jgi:arylsulfatase A-like enzyme
MALPSSFAADAPRRPNILFVITDDQRFDQMGNMNPLIHTPEMDRLAREGVRFESAFVTTAICAASRASLLCGLVERTHRYTFKTPPLGDTFANISFPKLLRDAGYRTAYVGKLGVNLKPGAQARLYDFFRESGHPYWKTQPDGSLRHLTDLEGERAMQFLDEHVRSADAKPFCLTVGFNAPHAEDAAPQQYFWQKELDSLYKNVTVPRPPLSDDDFYSHLPEFLRDGTMNRHRWQWRFNVESKRQEMTKGYWRMISGVDLVIGRLRQKLEQLNLASNTVIILIGDNGYFLGERGYADKWLPYEPSIRVPLLMFDPAGRFTKAGLRPTQFALNCDLAPTILELAGVRAPEKMQGRSLLPLARGETPADWRNEVWLEHLMMEPSIRKHEGVRTERYKYSRYFEAIPVLEELYDLQQDTLETVNLVNSPQHRTVLQQLRRRTDELRDQYGGEFSARLWKEASP